MKESSETGYFHRVNRLTQTRFWINNPTLEEAAKAIAAGAVSCTTNPTYAAKMLSSAGDTDRAKHAIRDCVSAGTESATLPAEVQRLVVKPIQELFLPIYERSGGRDGFVSIQGDPIHEDNSAGIVAAALADRRLGENIIAKVPVTEAGLRAIPELIEENVPVIATEVMSISQAVAVCEAYEKAATRSGRRPQFYVTHITGIFDEYLTNAVQQHHLSIEPDVLWVAGAAVARRQYQVMKERGYPGILLGGGARGLHHFTEFVGRDVHVTINWSHTAEDLVTTNPPVVSRFDCPVPASFVDELSEKIPEFHMAYHINGLEPKDFAGFGPVEYFRNSFIRGWKSLIAAIGDAGLEASNRR